MNSKDEQIDLTAGQISYLADRRLFSIVVAPTKISAVEAAEFKTTIRAMAKAQEQLIYVIFDIRKIKGFSKDGRDYFANDPKPMGRSAAILVGLGISRIVANFMLGMNKPPYPIKAFSNREKALNWLGSQKEKMIQTIANIMAKKIDKFGQLEYWLLDNGILEIRALEGIQKSKEISLEELEYTVNVQKQLAKEQNAKIILLAELSRMSKLSKAAKDYLKTEEGESVQQFVLANAFLVSNPFSRMFGNVLAATLRKNNLNPIKLFSNREEAIKWLLSFK